QDRPRRRLEFRDQWGIGTEESVALFAAINYRLKGLEPLLHAVRELVRRPEYRAVKNPFRLVVAGNPSYRGWHRLAERLGVPERRNACTYAARKTAGQWTFEQHYRHLLGIFSEAASRKRAA